MQFSVIKASLLGGLSSLIMSASAYANTSLAEIKTTIFNTITQQISVKSNEKIVVDIADQNIPMQYTYCKTPLTFNIPNNTHSEAINSIEIGCTAENWHSLIPIEVKVMVHALIAKHTLVPKSPITDDDLEYAEFNKNRLFAGYFEDKAEVIGNQSSHMILAGSLITPKSIHPPTVIHRNQIITIRAQRNQIVVNMQGIAKTDGAQDSMIKVYNPSSKRTLDAVVINETTAQVIS